MAAAQAINLKVTASVPVNCSFWLEDDGWIGTCDQFHIRVEGSGFEDAKRNMESSLQACLEKLLVGVESRRVA